MKLKTVLSFFLLACLFLQTERPCKAQEFALSTNMLGYVDFGTMNLEAAYGVSQHWSLSAGVKYNPFSYGKGEDELNMRQRCFSMGVKYWPWHIFSGWWFSSAARYQEYNSGGLSSVETSEGDRFGVSVVSGYTYMISPHLNLDFGIGMWGGYDLYTTYSCQTCGKKTDSGGKVFFMPSDVVLALTYIF